MQNEALGQKYTTSNFINTSKSMSLTACYLHVANQNCELKVDLFIFWSLDINPMIYSDYWPENNMPTFVDMKCIQLRWHKIRGIVWTDLVSCELILICTSQVRARLFLDHFCFIQSWANCRFEVRVVGWKNSQQSVLSTGYYLRYYVN